MYNQSEFTPDFDVLNEVESLIFSGNCVVFVGAAITNPPGKQWDVTVNKIATDCKVEYKNLSVKKIIDNCMEKDIEKCNSSFSKLYPKHSPITRTALNYLLRLPFKSLLTTNFDPWIRQNSTQEQYPRCYIYPDLPIVNGLKSCLFYLHGYFDSEKNDSCISKLVFGEKSFETAYKKSLLPGFLINLFVYYDVLFVCFDPTEENIIELLKTSNQIRKKIANENNIPLEKLPRRYILWPIKDFDINTINEDKKKEKENEFKEKTFSLNIMEITPVFYDPIDPNYSGLDKLLYELVERGDEKKRPSPFKTGFQT
jgi:hypothetical protein